MSCPSPFGFTPITEIVPSLDCCTLTFRDAAGDVCFTFNLANIAIITKSDKVIIKDGISHMSISVDDFLLLGLTADAIIAQADLCRCGAAAPIEEDVIDSEIVCVAENENIYILQVATPSGAITVIDTAGADVTGTVTPVKCPQERDNIKPIIKDVCYDDGTSGCLMMFVDTDTLAVVDSVQLDSTGAVTTANIIDCPVIEMGEQITTCT